MYASLTSWLRHLSRWLTHLYRRRRLKLTLLLYFLLVTVYKVFEIALVNVDLFDFSSTSSTSTSPTLCPSLIGASNWSSIDAVYTWVNGSDPQLLSQLHQTTLQLEARRLGGFCSHPHSDTDSFNKTCTLLPLLLVRPPLSTPGRHFPGLLKYQLFNQTATLLFFSSVLAVQPYTVHCVHQIDRQLYKLTGLYSCQPSRHPDLLINSLFRLTAVTDSDTQGRKSDEKRAPGSSSVTDPLKFLTPRTRKHLLSVSWKPEHPQHSGHLSSSDFLYTSMPTSSSSAGGALNLGKLVRLLQGKAEKSNDTEPTTAASSTSELYPPSYGNFTVEYPLAAVLADGAFFTHTLASNENGGRNRFADNDELRYSLRSLELYAPWIRTVYLVTNGQIPYWLNVENPKLRIVQHREIFPNSSHLPTFSSSAIECHLHRIANLSARFLYLNDDILLGQPIYPDDFYTASRGFKVYLSWPVPNCAEGCPLNWLNDGFCDKACDSARCLWDGGDCLRVAAANSGGNLGSNTSSAPSASVSSKDSSECASHCLFNWLGDGFCDQVCNTPKCAYDMGDCGIQNFTQFPSISLSPTQSSYTYPSNLNSTVLYLNFTSLLHVNDYHLELTEARYTNVSCILTAVLSTKYSLVTILFRPHTPRSPFSMLIIARLNQRTFDFTIAIDTEGSSSPSPTLPPFNLTSLLQQIQRNYQLPSFQNQSSPPPTEMPVTIDLGLQTVTPPCDLNLDTLPSSIRAKFTQIDTQQREGHLTEQGARYFTLQLQQLYLDLLCNVSTQPDHSSQNDTFSQFLLTYLSPNQSSPTGYRSRRLLDAYADSLIYVNHLYNTVFGVQSRQVVAHMPHFVDSAILARLQATFPEHFEATSSRQLRHSEDMQFSFAYFHYLMAESEDISLEATLSQYDTDQSGTLSLNELKTFAIQLFGLPLSEEHSRALYSALADCCTDCRLPVPSNATSYLSLWRQEQLPVDISIDDLLSSGNCTSWLSEMLPGKGPPRRRSRNKFELLNDQEVAFKMLRSNESLLEEELNELRSRRRKFLCLNDNLEHGVNVTRDAALRRLLKQFFSSLYPLPSTFERPAGQVNRFLYIDQYRAWRRDVDSAGDLYFSLSYLFILINVILFLKMLV